MSAYWAVLIGIDSYREAPLQGAVRDVQVVKQFLQSGTRPINITALTASRSPDRNSENPTEDPESWPTFNTLIASFRQIIQNAKPGDLVYIHYSGHGTRTYRDVAFSSKNTGDLALVLFDAVYGIRYLRGRQLESYLKSMVDKGLLVTLVLDCRFSESVLRHDDPNGCLVRALNYDPVVDAAYPPELDDSLPNRNGRFRDASIHNWLVEPTGYTILTACGPHERAMELVADDGKHHGALSYFLLSSLNSLARRGAAITHRSLHQHISMIFHVKRPG